MNKDIKRPAGIFPSLPSGMDKVLKVHFDSFRDKGELPPELKDLKGIKLFDDKALLDVWRSNFKGIRWADKEGNVLHGAVDNLLLKGKKIIVMDFKTRGFPIKEDTHKHYIDQMNIYNFLLRKNGYETEDYSYLLFYHPTGVNEKGEVIFHTDLIKIDVDVKRAEDLFNNAIKALNGKIPKASKECNYCNYCANRK
jgi:hypothetical protein